MTGHSNGIGGILIRGEAVPSSIFSERIRSSGGKPWRWATSLRRNVISGSGISCVLCVEFRVWSVQCRVWGVGFRVQGEGLSERQCCCVCAREMGTRPLPLSLYLSLSLLPLSVSPSRSLPTSSGKPWRWATSLLGNVISGSGISRVQGAGFRVWGVVCRVQGVGCRV